MKDAGQAMPREMHAGSQVGLVMLLSLLFVLITRLPFMPGHLFSFDSVNFALALEDFDPNRNQPQPPGYPFFVAEARLVQSLFGSAEATFTVIKILAAALSVGLLYLLVARMVSAGAGIVAAALLLVNPAFWHSSLASPIRPHLALFSVLFAYLCWRAAELRPRLFVLASLLLGLSAGFRLELPLILFPLWLWTAWQLADWKLALRALALAALGVAAWAVCTLLLTGAPGDSVGNLSRYFFVQTQQSSLLTGSDWQGWRRMLGRNLVWYGAGALCWIWSVYWGVDALKQSAPGRYRLGFLVIWFVPALVVNLLLHSAAPGHTLAAQAPLSALGAISLCAAEAAIRQRWQPRWPLGAALAGAVLISSTVFFAEHLPSRSETSRPALLRLSIPDPVRYGLYETSYAHVRWTDQMSSEAFRQIRALQQSTDKPVVVVWSREAEPVWRKVSYYFPDLPVYALEEDGEPAVPRTRAMLWKGSAVLAEYQLGDRVPVPVPPNSRIIWLLHGGAGARLRQAVTLSPAPPVYYTDLNPGMEFFDWRSFRFIAATQQVASSVGAP